MKHTPGPWVFEGAMNSKEIYIGPQRFFEYGGRPIPMPMQGPHQAVAMVVLASAGFDAVMKADEQIGNAHLISVAPEMLDALESFLAEALERKEKDRPFIIGVQELINKAKGKPF